MTDVYSLEDHDGVRMAWNAFATHTVDAKRTMHIPPAVLYSPLRLTSPANDGNMQTPQVPYEPVCCRACRAVLNPFCGLDLAGKLWTCAFCMQRNQFPVQYHAMSQASLPAELYPQFSTLEYLLPRQPSPTPAFLIVIDTCCGEEDFGPLKEGIISMINLLPQESRVGLVTIGTHSAIYDLSCKECPKSYIFNGSADITVEKVVALLGLTPKVGTQSKQGFLLPLSECEFTLISLLEDLQRDPWPVASDHRPLRSTGVALTIATAVLGSVCQGVGGRIVSFISGPCTTGPGMVVTDELKETIRSHHDIRKGTAKHLKKATAFYENLAQQLVTSGHTHDIFIASLDQVGLLEAESTATRTGGLVMMSTSFSHEMFHKSLLKCYEKNDKDVMNLAFNATLEIQLSRELKVCGAIGHVSSLNKKSAIVSETEIGIGGTSAWRMSSIDPNTSIAFYLQVTATQQDAIAHGSKAFIQFSTYYQLSNGKFVLRVTTLAKPFVDATARLPELASSFDQEAAATLMARIAAARINTEENHEVLRWLDRQLIALSQKYGSFNKGDPSSFQLPSNFSLYPGFMFHLRRSNFLQPFNNSPDESIWYRYTMNRENVSNTLVMIQPTLDSYAMGNPDPTPSPLSANSVLPDSILLMDSFFFVVVFLGHKVAQWKKDGYHEKPEHAEFARVLKAPVLDAQELMSNRFPHPRYIECVQYSGDARFLMSVVDPSVTHLNAQQQSKQGEAIFTEDVNMTVFMDHLRKLVVTAQQ